MAKKSTFKKVLKIVGIFLLVVVVALAAAPFIFKDKIKALVLKSINENVDATVAFEEVDLSLFRNFPNANVTIDKLSIINKAPFEGDTLFYAGELNLKMSIKELFKGDNEPMNLQGFSSTNAIVNVIFNKDGLGNFDIALKNQEEEASTEESKPFALNIQEYAINNLRFTFLDEGAKMKMVLDSLNHTGKGNFAQQKLDLDTKTSTKVSFEMDSTNFMKNVTLSLDAVLGIDLDNSKYEFKDNKALINQLPLEFNGFIQMLEDGQLYNLTFKTPTSDFKNFLGLIPEAYAGNISQVKTTGEFRVGGKVDGKLTETTIPKFNIELASDNASFQYPDLPKSVKNIVIDTHIVNETGAMNDTYVNLDKLSFSIDQDVFNAKALVKNLTENPLVDAALKGTINLANVTKAYPVQLDKPLTGILKADVTTKFDMKSVETSQYQNIQNAGNVSLSGFKYEGPEMAKPFEIVNTSLTFNPNQIRLNEFDAKTGSSDIQVTGGLDNLYGFLFKKQVLKGSFDMNSSRLVVSDFMSPTTTTSDDGSKTTTEAVKIPSFLDCSISAKAGSVVYDNLDLKNVSGNLAIKDEAISLSNLKMDVFGGSIGLNGMVSTKGAKPTFNMDLGLNAVNIAESFTQVEMLKSIAPIANIINGKLNSTIKLSGNLTDDMTPNLKTLSGDLAGQLLSTTINEKNSTLLTALSSNVKFLDVSKLNLNDIKASLSFKDGKVALKPLNLTYQDINMTVGGTHGFDQTMNYDVKFDVPAKYLGTEVTSLLSKLTPADQQKIESVPVTANLTGNFSNPAIKTDLKQATTNLASQIVKMQKEKLVNEGTSALTNLFNGTKDNSTATATDTTKTTTPKENIKEGVKNVLGGILGGKKKKE
ncbi:AsmA-like C-terminal region-containing protein [Flavobacterium sp. J27]|uniref:AsmA-like C-terminal region-containing protein n=1 Tax=Flavobacterium sp. J27 TaxID=2060419 RepID=UPI00102F990F|nr:AsmA-like C-terminal region-containing protein [Flavobacterium sp. J27]